MNELPRAKEIGQAAGLLILMLLLFYAPLLLRGESLLPTDLIFEVDPLWWSLAPDDFSEPSNPLLADQSNQFYPWEVFTRQSLSAGDLPLWNPYVGGGQPFVGNAQSGLFNPFNALGFLIPLPHSFLVEAILRLWLAGMLTYLLARALGQRHSAALLSGVVFSFSAPLTGWIGYPLASVMVWLPGLLLATEWLLNGTRWGWLVAAGAIGAQFLGGHPETSFPVLLVWGVYSLFRLGQRHGWRPNQTWLRMLTRLAGITTLGILLGGVQLLPFVENLWYSSALQIRQGELTNSANFLQRLLMDWHEWGSILTTILPHYFGVPMDNSYWYPYSNYLELVVYAGVLPLVLALMISWLAWRYPHTPHRRLILFLAAVAVTAVGIALRLPLFNIINELPLFNISETGRFRLVAVFVIALLAGFGLDSLQQTNNQRATRHVGRWLGLFAGGSLVLILVTYAGFSYFADEFVQRGYAFVDAQAGTPYLTRPLEYYYQIVRERQTAKLNLYLPQNIVMYLPLLTALGWFGLQQWQRRRPLQPGLFNSLLIVAVGIDLFLVSVPFTPHVAPENIFPTPALLTADLPTAQDGRIAALGQTLNPNTGMVFNLADVRSYDPMMPHRFQALFSSLDGYFPIHHHALLSHAAAPQLDWLNVTHLLSTSQPGNRWELVRQVDDVGLYRSATALPRAFVVHQIVPATDAATSLALVLAPDFDARLRAVVENAPAPAFTPAPDATQQVTVHRPSPNRLSLVVETSHPGWLVISETFMPGWTATIDDEPKPIYITNHAFRGMPIAAGTHHIELSYEPLSFRLGAGLSMAGLLIVGLGVALTIIANRKRR